MVTDHFDMLIIGSGAAGQRAAIQTAKLGKRVAVVERGDELGGAALRAGTIPSKALREAALVLVGATTSLGLSAGGRTIRRDVSVRELRTLTADVIAAQRRVLEDAFARNRIEVLWGVARFEDRRTVIVAHDNTSRPVTADRFVIATGTRPAMPPDVPFDGRIAMTTDTLGNLETLPRSMLVVGGGVIGTELACILAALGVEVTLLDAREELLGFVDREIIEAFQTAIRRLGVTLRLGEKVLKIERRDAAGVAAVQATLESGKELHGACLLYAVGRQGTCRELALEKVGIPYDERERLRVNEHYQTVVPHIYAAGDVIGFPALAATAMEQGRLAACHAFGAPARAVATLFPYGIYSIPEMSMVGLTEQALTKARIPYETGVARYEELARAKMLGDRDGLLKLLVHQKDRRLLGVHCIGTSATELVHVGQMVMAYGGTVDDLVDNVFNYPTLAEAYKVAAHNAVNKLPIR